MNSTLTILLVVGAVFAVVLIISMIKKWIDKQNAEENKRLKIIELEEKRNSIAQQRYQFDISEGISNEYKQLVKKEIELECELKLLSPNQTGTIDPINDAYMRILKGHLKPQ